MSKETEEQTTRVIDLFPAIDDALKPSELIKISGHQGLSLNARRAITVLWHAAHRQGVENGKDYSIELSELRPDGHKGNEMIEEAVISLMQTILTLQLPDGATRRVQFLGGNDMDDPTRPAGRLTFSFDKRLTELLADSRVWGKIAIPTLMAFSSKYSVSLYENIAQWQNLAYKQHQEFTLDEFRDLLGVEPGKYPNFGGLNKHVLKTALDEINALASFNVVLVPIKEGRAVARVRVAWWPKSEDELKDAHAEAQRPRVGRRARISGKAEYVQPSPSLASRARAARIEQRKAGKGD
jgi:hypothetical protein